MSNTITLPDNITFEEIAAKWCAIYDCLYCTGITFYKLKKKKKIEIVNCFEIYEGNYRGDVCSKSAADYYPSDRKILIRDEEKFQPILDYIKERSNAE